MTWAAAVLCDVDNCMFPRREIKQTVNLAGCCIWIRNLVAHIEGGILAEGFRE